MTQANKKILISAGGTGGHIFPAEALARDLIGRGYHVSLATDKRGADYKNFAGGIPTYVLKSSGLKSGILSKISTAMSLAVGVMQAGSLLKKLNPQIVVGFGGYPSFPAVYAAQKKNIPTILHEQNAILGKANVYLAPKADRIALPLNNVAGMNEEDKIRSVVIGNPVRTEIAALYNEPYPAIEQDGVLKILILGGSLGASVFSEVIPDMVEKLADHYKNRLEIVQQCRAEDVDAVRARYQEIGVKAELEIFFDDVASKLAETHLVIARSGASTVAEVTTAGRPAIFVPYPHHKDQQQKRNADAVFDAGGAWVMTEDGFNADTLQARIEAFLQSPETLFTAAENARGCGRPDAARRLGNLVTALASGWDKKANQAFDPTQSRG